jgi:hypothetical protein
VATVSPSPCVAVKQNVENCTHLIVVNVVFPSPRNFPMRVSMFRATQVIPMDIGFIECLRTALEKALMRRARFEFDFRRILRASDSGLIHQFAVNSFNHVGLVQVVGSEVCGAYR